MSLWLGYKIKRGLAPRGRVPKNYVPQPTTLVAKMIGTFMRGKKDEELSGKTRL